MGDDHCGHDDSHFRSSVGGRGYKTDAQALGAAFAYFNKAINRASLESAFDETLKMINNGQHPVADAAFIKVGSYMAMKLIERYGAERAKTYHTMGALPFFPDYIEMYKANPQYPVALRFNASFEETITRWNRDWQRTWNKDVRRFASDTEGNFNALEPKLKEMFAGASISPDLLEQIRQFEHQTSERRDWQTGYRASKLMADLCPESDLANVYLTVNALTLVRQTEATAALRRAVQIHPQGIASARVLDVIALSLMKQKLPDVAINWLRLALEIYPKEIPLYASLGEYLVLTGEREQALEVYRKAREIDPKFTGMG